MSMNIKDFIVNNWQYISSVLVIIITIIFAFIKKRPFCQIIDDSYYEELCRLIKNAEVKFGSGNGDKKLNFVIECFLKEHGKDINSIFIPAVKTYLSQTVNDILDTPQRRERRKK